MDVFEARIAMDGERAAIDVEAEEALGRPGRDLAKIVLPMNRIAATRRASAPSRNGASEQPSSWPGNATSGEFEDRRHDIDGFGEGIDPPGGTGRRGSRMISGT